MTGKHTQTRSASIPTGSSRTVHRIRACETLRRLRLGLVGGQSKIQHPSSIDAPPIETASDGTMLQSLPRKIFCRGFPVHKHSTRVACL